MKCLFCGSAEGDSLSKEHLISQPVADSFGIDRSDSLATVDGWTPGSEDFELVRMTRISDLAVKLPCRTCNSGWMNDLEQGMASVARWARAGDNGLSRDAHRTLRRWLLKTYIVFTAIDGGMRRFGSSDDFHMIPDATRARLLWQNDDRALENVAFGFARSGTAGAFGYGFGNPSVIPAGPQHANCRSAGALTLTLGTLSACVAVPVFAADVSLPSAYRPLASGHRYRALKRTDRLPQVDEIVVDNGDHDIRLITEALVAWADEQSPGAA